MAFNPAVTKEQVAELVGGLEMWRDEPNAIAFRPSYTITFKQLNAISELFGTDHIDLCAGREGEPDWSEVTPGWPAECGEITVYKDAA